jgi:hypothetical protein
MHVTNDERNLSRIIEWVKFDAECKMGMAHIRTRFVIRLSRYYGRKLGVSSDLHLQIIPHSGIYLLRFVNLHGDFRIIPETAPKDWEAKALDLAEVRRDPIAAVVQMLVCDRADRIRAGLTSHLVEPHVISPLRAAARAWREAGPS